MADDVIDKFETIENLSESEALINKVQGSYLMEKKQRSKISCQGPFNSDLLCEIPYKAKLRGILRNFAEFGRIPWHGIPYNSAEF
jgi:hypothetical protein